MIILVTTPAPTVLPPSRIAKCICSSSATGVTSFTESFTPRSGDLYFAKTKLGADPNLANLRVTRESGGVYTNVFLAASSFTWNALGYWELQVNVPSVEGNYLVTSTPDCINQEVTGLTTNEFVNVNRKFLREVRAMLHPWELKGYQRTEQRFYVKYCKKLDKPYKHLPTFHQVIKGKIEFVKMVRGNEDGIFVRYNNKAVELETRDRLTPVLFEEIPIKERSKLISGKEQKDLLDKVKKYFSIAETHELCLELDIEAEEFLSSRTDMQRQLIGYLNRRGRISELISICERERPGISWNTSD